MKFSLKNILIRINAFFVFSFCIFAEPSFNIWGSGKTFKLDPLTDGVLAGSGVLLSGTGLAFDKVLKLNRTEFDSSEIYSKNSINGFDRCFMQPFSKKTDTAADITLAAAVLSPAVLAFTDCQEWLTVVVMYAESVLIANGIKELSKISVNRARPYVYYDSAKPVDSLKDGDWADSFPSGHSTLSFTGAAFASYAFAKYFPDSKWKYAVAAGSYSLAAATAVLRVAGGNHFATDVLTGAAIGTGIGILVPWLHTFNRNHDLNINASGTGVSFIYRPGSSAEKAGM